MSVTQREPVTKVAVLIPTYNERENLPGIVARVRASVPTADVIVLDDNSPDGTGELAEGLAAADDHVRVVHRPGSVIFARRLRRLLEDLQRSRDIRVARSLGDEERSRGREIGCCERTENHPVRRTAVIGGR